MNDMIENIQAIDRAWPVKPQSREDMVDELIRDQLFRSGEWLSEEDPDNKSAILGEVLYLLFRDGSLLNDNQRATEIKAHIRGYIEAWAERKAEEEE